jgi:cobalt-zinc-cadmium efflux system outer membrane protein
VEEAAKKPDLTFSAGFRRVNIEDTSAWVAGVSIPLPLFDKRQGAVAEARIRVEQAFSEQKALERRLRADIARVRHEHEMALLESTSLTGTVLPAARNVLSATEEGYRLGKFEYLNVLDAQRTYAELQRRYIEAVASGLKAAIEMERMSRCEDSDPKGRSDE